MNDVSTTTPPRTLDDVLALSHDDRRAIDELISRRLASDVVLVNQIGHHIIHGGGKRLRPLLHVLCARAAGYRGASHIQLAVVIEFIHTATLLHDDVIDESGLRRGRETAHRIWGNAASVLVGDFLYSRSFQLMVELDRLAIMRILADTTNTIAEGEVLQLMQMGNLDLTEQDYFRVISDKTACLFAASARLGGEIAERDEATCDKMEQFGLMLGQAFQIADDVLDYQADGNELGKNLGDDLAEGKVTLPLILALQQAGSEDAARLRDIIAEGHADGLEEARRILEATGALEQSLERARLLARQAEALLEALPHSPYRSALSVLTRYAVDRSL
ncbi:polyprenyl synthetase family protein [Wenzhouxiangella limi]|uniref:Octaprenyl diphosphate synthase n=1 Tax=Wenzhouxiangella limi TaxID=2707351 RepID=A0A845VHS3_9GAMM|nr:polyprenyl synthetase family protein [Wenzhouxiangella limi]NDY96739.1 octaprenyl-diphosphate synthase [Wenzhouxiangella limi]